MLNLPSVHYFPKRPFFSSSYKPKNLNLELATLRSASPGKLLAQTAEVHVTGLHAGSQLLPLRTPHARGGAGGGGEGGEGGQLKVTTQPGAPPHTPTAPPAPAAPVRQRRG
jgi:hypothetical protein